MGQIQSQAAVDTCRGRVVRLDHHVSRQGLPWVSGLLESAAGLDRFEIWPVPYRGVWGLTRGCRVAFVAWVDLRDQPKLIVQTVEVLP